MKYQETNSRIRLRQLTSLLNAAEILGVTEFDLEGKITMRVGVAQVHISRNECESTGFTVDLTAHGMPEEFAEAFGMLVGLMSVDTCCQKEAMKKKESMADAALTYLKGLSPEELEDFLNEAIGEDFPDWTEEDFAAAAEANRHTQLYKGQDLYTWEQVRDLFSWKPIKTAPLNQTRVLVWHAEYFEPRISRHMDYGWEDCLQEPTHWMPLPSAPST